jgi:hypothetical protein
MGRSGKDKRLESTAPSTRVLDDADAAVFTVAAEEYVEANTVSRSTARKKLQELGLIDSSGKPTKHYR